MSSFSRIAGLAFVCVALAHQAQAAVATDNFDRSNGGLGANWATNVDGGGSLRIISNRVQPAAGTYGESLYTGGTFGGRQFSEIQHVSGLAGGVINLVVRARQYTGGNLSDSYRGQLNGLSRQWRILRVVNNVETVLASGALTFANGDTFAFTADGAALTLARNGVTLGGTSDSSFTTGAPGVGIYNQSSLLADNWRGGDYTTTGGGGGGTGGSKYTFVTNKTGTPYVASYRVGANGGFTQVSAVSVGIPTTGVAVTPSANHVIVAADPGDTADGSLRVYSVSSTGALSFVSSVPMGPGTGGYSHTVGCGPRPGNTGGATSCGLGLNSAPETVLIHPNGRFVYVMDGVAGGACNPPGVAPCVPPAGTPSAGNRVIVRYTFDPATGRLAYHEQRYVEGFVSFTMDPRGRFVWATSYLEHKIYEFRIDQATGALTFGTGTFIGMSNGSMRMAVDPAGTHAYVSHAGDRTIDSYTINQSTGHLFNIGSINGNCGAPGANCNKATNVTVSGLAVSANGRTLYGASSGVIAYALGADGSIGARLVGSPFNPRIPLVGGASRALVGIGSAGQYLYLQGYSEGATRVFSINPTTGVLTETAASPTALASATRGVTALALQ